MPHIKNALLRFRIIDKMIRNKYKSFPSKQELREACEESLYGSIDGAHICNSTIEKEDYLMGELQQKSAETGLLKHVTFGRNEPALHHFHSTFAEVLGMPPLEKVEA